MDKAGKRRVVEDAKSVATTSKSTTQGQIGAKGTQDGFNYQTKIISWLVLQFIQDQDTSAFSILTEVGKDIGGDFDDVVCVYVDSSNRLHKVFIQSKHKTESNLVIKKDMLFKKEASDYSLIKYYNSFVTCILPKLSKDEHCKVILFTNAGLDEEATHYMDTLTITSEDHLLKSLNSGTLYGLKDLFKHGIAQEGSIDTSSISHLTQIKKFNIDMYSKEAMDTFYKTVDTSETWKMIEKDINNYLKKKKCPYSEKEQHNYAIEIAQVILKYLYKYISNLQCNKKEEMFLQQTILGNVLNQYTKNANETVKSIKKNCVKASIYESGNERINDVINEYMRQAFAMRGLEEGVIHYIRCGDHTKIMKHIQLLGNILIEQFTDVVREYTLCDDQDVKQILEDIKCYANVNKINEKVNLAPQTQRLKNIVNMYIDDIDSAKEINKILEKYASDTTDSETIDNSKKTINNVSYSSGFNDVATDVFKNYVNDLLDNKIFDHRADSKICGVNAESLTKVKNFFEPMKYFIESFVLAEGQNNVDEIDTMIKRLLHQLPYFQDLQPQEVNLVFNIFYGNIKKWFENNPCLSKKNSLHLLTKTEVEYHSNRIYSYYKQLYSGIEFNGSYLKQMYKEISDTDIKNIIHYSIGSIENEYEHRILMGRLRILMLKIIQSVASQVGGKYYFIDVSDNQIQWEHLQNDENIQGFILDCSKCNQEDIVKIVDLIKNHKIILVTRGDSCKMKCIHKYEKLEYQQLLEESPIFAKKILDFQGKIFSFRNFLNDVSVIKDINFDGKAITELCSGELVEFGEKYDICKILCGYYTKCYYKVDINCLSRLVKTKCDWEFFVTSELKDYHRYNIDLKREFLNKCHDDEIKRLLDSKNIRIFKRDINFSTEESQFQSVCKESRLTFWIHMENVEDKYIFYLKQIYDPEYYIKRKLKYIPSRNLEKNIVESLNKNDKHIKFVISGVADNNMSVLSPALNCQDTEINQWIVKKNIFIEQDESAGEVYHDLCKDGNKVYWFNLRDDRLVMKKFHKKPLVTKICSEEDMCNIEERLIVISGTPGSGKTTTLKYMRYYLSEKMIIVRIDFKDADVRKDLGDLRNKIFKKNITYFIQCRNYMNLHSYLSKQILKYYLYNTSRVSFFMDGFDELASEDQTTVLHMIDFLIENTNCKIYLTTRIHCNEVLEERYLVKCTMFEELSEECVSDIFNNFFNYHMCLLRPDVDSTVQETVREIMTLWNSKLKQALGMNPLHIQLIYEVYLHELIENPHKHINKAFSLHYFIDRSVEQKFAIFFNEKNPMRGTSEESALREVFEDIIRKLAVQLIYPEHYNGLIKFDKEHQYFNSIMLIGIVQQQNSNGQIDFTHRTYAEYFTIKYLLMNYKEPGKAKKIICDLINDSDSTMLREFLYEEVVKGNPLHEAIWNNDCVWFYSNIIKYNSSPKRVLGFTPFEFDLMCGRMEFLVSLQPQLINQVDLSDFIQRMEWYPKNLKMFLDYLLIKCRIPPLYYQCVRKDDFSDVLLKDSKNLSDHLKCLLQFNNIIDEQLSIEDMRQYEKLLIKLVVKEFYEQDDTDIQIKEIDENVKKAIAVFEYESKRCFLFRANYTDSIVDTPCVFMKTSNKELQCDDVIRYKLISDEDLLTVIQYLSGKDILSLEQIRNNEQFIKLLKDVGLINTLRYIKDDKNTDPDNQILHSEVNISDHTFGYDYSETELHKAVHSGDYELVRHLLNNCGANPKTKDEHNRLPIEYSNNYETSIALLRHGVRLSLPLEDRDTQVILQLISAMHIKLDGDELAQFMQNNANYLPNRNSYCICNDLNTYCTASILSYQQQNYLVLWICRNYYEYNMWNTTERLNLINNLSWQDEDGTSFLDIAMRSDNWGMMDYLLKAGVVCDSEKLLGQTREGSEVYEELQLINKSFEYVKSNNVEELKSLSLRPNNLTTRDIQGKTLTHYAVDNDYVDIIKLLLFKYKYRTDVNNMCDSRGRTPLHYVKSVGSLYLLLEHGAMYDGKDTDGNTPLDLCQVQDIRKYITRIGEIFNSVKNRVIKEALLQLENIKKEDKQLFSCIVNTMDRDGRTLIDLAQIHESMKLLHFVSSNGGWIRDPVNMPESTNSDIKVFQNIIKDAWEETFGPYHFIHLDDTTKKSIVNVRIDDFGWTLLHRVEDKYMVKVLLEEMSEEMINRRDREGYTPLMTDIVGVEYLNREHHHPIVLMLCEHNVDVNIPPNKRGVTPLREATKGGNYDIYNYLISKGADGVYKDRKTFDDSDIDSDNDMDNDNDSSINGDNDSNNHSDIDSNNDSDK